MATIKDVARRANVSIKTVSRVVNGAPEVSEKTRQTVHQAILELGYQPNTLARSLVNGRTNTIGVVIPHSANYIFTHLFFSEVLRGIAEVLSASHFNLLLHLTQEDAPYVDLFLRHQVDGLILMSIPSGDPNLAGLQESGYPCVFTCRISEGNNPTHWVDADFTGGAELAAEHLIALGHRRIAVIAGPGELISVRLRLQGTQRALRRHGIPLPEEYIRTSDFTSESGHARAIELMDLPRPPTALLCGDDMIAFGATGALKELEYRIPEDVSVVGFDDISLAPFFSPPLTTVHQDAHEKGRLAASTLLALLQHPDAAQPVQINLETFLVIRSSTASAPV